MIKAIFFDMGNVICQEGFKSGIRQYEQELNIPEGEFYKIVHDFQGWKNFTLGLISTEQYLRMCEKRSGKYTFDGNRYFELVKKFTKPNQELINYIKSELTNQYIIGIISNHPKDWYEDFIEKTGLKDMVKAHIISCYEHIRKPDKKIFQIALDKAGVKAEESIYVDDRIDRVDGAKALGMRIVIFDRNTDILKKTNK